MSRVLCQAVPATKSRVPSRSQSHAQKTVPPHRPPGPQQRTSGEHLGQRPAVDRSALRGRGEPGPSSHRSPPPTGNGCPEYVSRSPEHAPLFCRPASVGARAPSVTASAVDTGGRTYSS